MPAIFYFVGILVFSLETEEKVMVTGGRQREKKQENLMGGELKNQNLQGKTKKNPTPRKSKP